RRGRPQLAEDLAVRASDRLPVRRVRDEDAGADDVLRSGVELAESGDDDLEAALRLLVRVGGVAADRRRPRDVDVPSVAHGARVADGVGERGDRRDGTPLHAPSIPRSWTRCDSSTAG